MIFSSVAFFVYLFCLMGLLAATPQPWRKWILLAFSYFFYAYWDYRFLALMLVSTLVDFAAGYYLDQTVNQRKRRLLLIASMIVNLSFLGFFKYFNFFIDNAKLLLAVFGLHVNTPAIYIILPAGISFYTFESMSYVIDVYHRKITANQRFLDFALFIAFFPKLVAGPIVRTNEFMPQLHHPIQLRTDNIWAGAQIFMIGLFKKTMIADAVAPFVDLVYEYPDYYSSSTIWLAIIAYSLQIYADFSGYSDMAIGVAKMLGFDLPCNFNMPYIASSITNFWRRWHISLSNWLRDYLYISLGGNRKGTIHTYKNLIITMVLGGLWHGASWNFVIWGTLHGFALALHRFWQQHTKINSRLSVFGGWVITLLFVMLSWVLFRTQNISTMLIVYQKAFFWDATSTVWHYHTVFWALSFVVIGHVVGMLRNAEQLVFFRSPYSYRAAFVTMFIIWIIFVFAPTSVSPFIYFQF